MREDEKTEVWFLLISFKQRLGQPPYLSSPPPFLSFLPSVLPTSPSLHWNYSQFTGWHLKLASGLVSFQYLTYRHRHTAFTTALYYTEIRGKAAKLTILVSNISLNHSGMMAHLLQLTKKINRERENHHLCQKKAHGYSRFNCYLLWHFTCWGVSRKNQFLSMCN